MGCAKATEPGIFIMRYTHNTRSGAVSYDDATALGSFTYEVIGAWTVTVNGLALSASGTFLYATGVKDGVVATLQRDINQGGKLTLQSALVEGAREAIAIVCTPDDRHCYVSSHEAKIRAYSRNAATGELTKVQTFSLATGNQLWTLALSPDATTLYSGRWDAAARELHVFSRDPASGMISTVTAFTTTHRVQFLALSQSGRRLLAASYDDGACTE